jgi:citrate lyase synthetase
MKQILPKYGVEVIEIPRIGGISASLVRKAMAEGNLELVSKIVPETTMEYIRAEN